MRESWNQRYMGRERQVRGTHGGEWTHELRTFYWRICFDKNLVYLLIQLKIYIACLVINLKIFMHKMVIYYVTCRNKTKKHFQKIVKWTIFNMLLNLLYLLIVHDPLFLLLSLLLLHPNTAWLNIPHYILISFFNTLWGSKLKVWF